MASFELYYDEEDDSFEVTFAEFDSNFARTLVLNDNIVIHTDMGFTTVWGISFYEYAGLLQVSETHLDGLRALAPEQYARVQTLIEKPPVSFFLHLLYPDEYRAFVKTPTLSQLIKGE
ncbi:MAG: hypothetical protein H7308_06625 [Chthonomonadaceae bacterium]|nr:hypothetical protein [Chthonomonadaceae bacterium]